MTIVLDVSAAIQILLKKEKKDNFSRFFEKASWVIAPNLYISEITNVFWKYYHVKILDEKECMQFLNDGINMIDNLFEEKEIWEEVFSESVKYQHAAYDLFYAVLARRNNAVLVSNDNKLLEIARSLKIQTSS